AARALAVTLCSGNRLAADYDTLSGLLCRQSATCSIGYASVAPDESEKERKLVENLMDSPLLGGSSKLKNADAVLLVLNGGSGLSLGDARSIFENAQKYLSPDCEVLIGAGADSSWGENMQLAAVAIKFEKSATEERPLEQTTVTKKGKKKRADAEDEFQPDLFSAQTNELGVMEGTTPVIIDGVNLDVPTFMRKNIPVDRRN
ncbi:MAG: hypothetical protein J6S54_10300, partial [Lentisphaeria bacterium]|nr:hypothetical protein [Lentisphaeria bacterium]